MDEPPFEFLLRPVLTEGERAVILLQMARASYEEFAKLRGFEPDWDSLPVQEKQVWGAIVRRAFRVMLSLVGDKLKAAAI